MGVWKRFRKGVSNVIFSIRCFLNNYIFWPFGMMVTDLLEGPSSERCVDLQNSCRGRPQAILFRTKTDETTGETTELEYELELLEDDKMVPDGIEVVEITLENQTVLRYKVLDKLE